MKTVIITNIAGNKFISTKTGKVELTSNKSLADTHSPETRLSFVIPAYSLVFNQQLMSQTISDCAESYNFGYCAFYTYQKRSENPFEPQTNDYIFWIQGFVQAEIDHNNEKLSITL